MHCVKCGKKISLDASFCASCGTKVDRQNVKNLEENTAASVRNPHKRHLIVIVVVICLVVYFFCCRCRAGFCPLPSNLNGEYCFVHTCQVNSCANKKAVNKDYCYTHSHTSSSGGIYTPEVAKNVLDFSNVNISHNSSYTICTGTITNNGRRTYSFVKIKGKFQDAYGAILDTDWTYAVGSEELAPGETTTFRMSVNKNRDITKCTIEIIDYDRE